VASPPPKRYAHASASSSRFAHHSCACGQALRAGFDVTVYEQTDAIGGNWVFRESETHASVYRSTFINTSKQAMVYSDFSSKLMGHLFLSAFCFHESLILASFSLM
jgi:hypothetical protein